MSNISTKNIPDSNPNDKKFTPKQIQPGNIKARILKACLEDSPFVDNVGEVNLALYLEGEDLGPNFEGFLIDNKDATKGKYKGQVAKVKFNEYYYKDGFTPGGMELNKVRDLLVSLKVLCVAVGCEDWLLAQDDKHPTIESMFKAFETEAPYKDVWLHFCIAGREYLNKKQYKAYELFLPRESKLGVALSKDESKVQKFFESEHIRKAKPKADPAPTQTPVVDQPKVTSNTPNTDALLKEHEQQHADLIAKHGEVIKTEDHSDIILTNNNALDTEVDDLPFTLD